MRARSLVLLVIAVLCVLCPETALAAERMNVIDYYNMSRTAEHQKIRQVNGVWHVLANSLVPLKVADIANGYLEFEDHGYNDGQGTETVTVALFLTKERQPILAVLDAGWMPDATCPNRSYTFNLFRLEKESMYEADDAMPSLPVSLFLKKGFVPKKSDIYEIPGRLLIRIGYRLPQKGTTMEAFLDTADLSCSIAVNDAKTSEKERDDAREFLKNVQKEPLKLKWNKAAGKFSLQADQ